MSIDGDKIPENKLLKYRVLTGTVNVFSPLDLTRTIHH